MTENEAQLLRERGLAFFGKILAAQTHELTNVLNVINELTGLQEDVLTAAPPAPLQVEKLQRILEKVRHQLQRGSALLRLLNGFAHSVDSPVSTFDVREALSQIIALAQRSATLAKAELAPDFAARSQSLETSLFGFQHAVFTCIEQALVAPVQQRRIAVGQRPVEAGTEITISSAAPISDGPEASRARAFLELLMHELGGRLAAESAANAPHRITLFFPSSQPHTAAGGRASGDAEDSHAT